MVKGRCERPSKFSAQIRESWVTTDGGPLGAVGGCRLVADGIIHITDSKDPLPDPKEIWEELWGAGKEVWEFLTGK